MTDNDKKNTGNFDVTDNAVLVRCRVQRFHQQHCSNSKKTNQVNKTKRQSLALPSALQSAKKLTHDTPPTAACKEESPGLLNLRQSQAESRLSPASEPSSRRLGVLKFMSGGRGNEETATNAPTPKVAAVANNQMAIGDDPGPFELALLEKLKLFGPVLVIMPEEGDADAVLVELSPLDVCCREKLRLDGHSMTRLTSVPSFDEMRRQ